MAKLYPHSNRFNKTQYKKSGEFRPPKAGEFFLSGAIPEVYDVPNDLSSSFYIMEPATAPAPRVRVKGIWYRLDHNQGKGT